jgi:hypothetical protein
LRLQQQDEGEIVESWMRDDLVHPVVVIYDKKANDLELFDIACAIALI